ncbi:amidohydrolase [Aestuariivirga sp.]|uniref:amidohydrolase n=1 Tax=Aestuariivirga sp. TaxID=2650926 RepID=UPI0035941C2B
MINRRTFMLFASTALAIRPALAADMADIIYSGGPILTMNDANPRVEVVAVKGGRIMAAGTSADLMKLKNDKTRMVDLGGRTMLPGFVDPHGHMMMGGLQALSANMLPPPDGEITSIADIQNTLRAWAEANKETVTGANLIMGFGYDDSQLKELRPPTKEELDEVSKDIPVLIVHQSGHIGACNTKCIDVIGYTAETPDPAGGVIRRKEGSQEPSGIIEESAWFGAIPKIFKNVGPRGMTVLAKAGADLWASFGYTTAQEGRSVTGVSKVLKAVADQGGFKIDVVAYGDVMVDRDYVKSNISMTYTNRFRQGGGKLTIDGSPQGFTAWRDKPYFDPVGNFKPGYSGYPAVTPEQVFETVDWAYANNIQLLSHSNGEASSDVLIAALREAQKKHGKSDLRPVLIHGQFQREDQVQSFVDLGVFPSLFPMHTFYWGDWHRDHTVGPVGADNISPTGWYRNRGAMFSTHTDAPVAFPDTMRTLDSTVTRRTRSGDILGPDQRVDVITALKAMTIWPAWQHFEEATKGSIEKGKLADFVILTEDPTAVDADTIDQIKIAETIKEGVAIYTASPEKLKKADAGRENGFSNFLGKLASERDFRSLPEKRQTPLMKKLLSSAPHNRGCVSGVLADMTEAMLSGDRV